jgi:sugar/nucleoside kinase (ribokinase family)
MTISTLDASRPIDVIVSGHLCIDLIPAMAQIAPQQLAEAGRLFEVGPAQISTGGAVSNTGLALHRLGVNVKLMSTVGGDLLGGLILEALRQRDPALTEHILLRPELPSSYTVILTPALRDRTFLHCTGTNDTYGVSDIDFETVARAKHFHLGYPTLLPRMTANDGEELCATFQRAKQAGAQTSLDLTVPDINGSSGRLDWGSILANTLPYVDIFMPSIEEILFMLRRADFDAWQNHGNVLKHLSREYLRGLADELLEMGVKIAGFKLSELGLYLHTADSETLPDAWRGIELWSPAFQVKLAGTTGAGDAAYAGFLASQLRGYSPAECVQWACAVGACCVEAPDATSGVRSWVDTQARIDAGWEVRVDRLAGF